MSEAVITVENLSKRYLIEHKLGSQGHNRYTALRDVIAREVSNVARKTIGMLAKPCGALVDQKTYAERHWP